MSTEWDNQCLSQRVAQAHQFATEWSQECGLQEALELLNHKHRICRYFAVQILNRTANSEDVESILLPLVQALKKEDREQITSLKSDLLNFIFAWSIKSFIIGSKFHWYVTVETKSSQYSDLFKWIHWKFLATLKKHLEVSMFLDNITKQQILDEKLTQICSNIKAQKAPRQKKIEMLRFALDPYSGINYKWDEVFGSSEGIYLPLHQRYKVVGLIPEEASVFKSAKSPISLSFRTEHNTTYKVIYKTGDDLRQDQLVVNMINFMDRMLKRHNLDLCLSPYNVMATNFESGFVEIIPNSMALSAVFSEYKGGIQEYLKILDYKPKLTTAFVPSSQYGNNNNNNNSGELDSHTVLENYIKSCAGYAVITYLLGVGDRHFDNILLTTNGNLFHIDFGFLFGNDPKPFPPPVRLCPEMIDGMGGFESHNFVLFKNYCCDAYNVLRKYAFVIVNMLNLMLEAGIPQLTGPRSVAAVKEKFRLELDDNEASEALLHVIDKSLKMIFPQITETLHRIAQMTKS